ncbi:MAG: zinc ribbon domain-containing protein [Thermoanaerobaculia bacterium]
MSDAGICAKCGLREVRVVAVKGRQDGASIPFSWFRSTRINHHVCTNCGYVEMWATDRSHLQEIAKRWPLK